MITAKVLITDLSLNISQQISLLFLKSIPLHFLIPSKYILCRFSCYIESNFGRRHRSNSNVTHSSWGPVFKLIYSIPSYLPADFSCFGVFHFNFIHKLSDRNQLSFYTQQNSHKAAGFFLTLSQGFLHDRLKQCSPRIFVAPKYKVLIVDHV